MSWFAKAKEWLGIGKNEEDAPSPEATRGAPGDAPPQHTGHRHHHKRSRQQGVHVAGPVPAWQPVLQEVPWGHGGIQGLTFYASSQRVDEDGELAQAFYEEQPGQQGMVQKRGHPPRSHPLVSGVQQGNILLAKRGSTSSSKQKG